MRHHIVSPLTPPPQPLNTAAAGEVGRGFSHKDATIDDLIRVIQSVASGQSVVPVDVTTCLFGNDSAKKATHPADILTEREREVMAFLAKGMTNKEIAARLNISANTVRAYVHTILEKFGVAIRTQAALYAIENNIIENNIIAE